MKKAVIAVLAALAAFAASAIEIREVEFPADEIPATNPRIERRGDVVTHIEVFGAFETRPDGSVKTPRRPRPRARRSSRRLPRPRGRRWNAQRFRPRSRRFSPPAARQRRQTKLPSPSANNIFATLHFKLFP